MKSLLSLTLTALIIISCGHDQDEKKIDTFKTIKINLSGYVDVIDSDFNQGRITDNSDNAVTAIMIHKDGSMYADGIFFPSVTEISLDISEGTYTFYVHSYKKGTGYGMEQVNNTVKFNGQYIPIANEFSQPPHNVGTYSSSGVIYTTNDSSSVQHTSFPELDAYAADTTISFDELSNGDVINIELNRMSSGIEIIATNFDTGEISLELVNESIPSHSYSYSLQHPTDSIFHIVAVRGTWQFKNNVLTNIYISKDGLQELLFSDYLEYHENKIKRFEVNAATGNGMSVTYNDENFVRGDTLRIGN